MPKTFSTLIYAVENARQAEQEAAEREESARKSRNEKFAKLVAAERELANALHLLGKPVVAGSKLYRLSGVGDRALLQIVEFCESYATDVPEMPADLTVVSAPAGEPDQATQIWASGTPAAAEAAVVVS
jgi:hypothetical protein